MSATVLIGILNLVEVVVAITLNSIIILLHMRSVKCGSKLSPVDMIHVVMGMVNISLASFLLGHFLGMSLSASYPARSFHITIIPLPFLMYYTFWLTAWLCAYYCTSISTFRSCLFSCMKTCLRASLPYLLVSSGLGSLIISIPAFWILHLQVEGQYSENGTFIVTDIGVGSKSVVYTVVGNLLGCCLPFIVILVSLMTSVSSLMRHVWNIKQNNPESNGPKLQIHINAIRTMILLLILSGLFYTAENILFSVHSMDDMKIVVSWCLIIVFPTAEAIIMIQASHNLRRICCPAKMMKTIKTWRTMNHPV